MSKDHSGKQKKKSSLLKKTRLLALVGLAVGSSNVKAMETEEGKVFTPKSAPLKPKPPVAKKPQMAAAFAAIAKSAVSARVKAGVLPTAAPPAVQEEWKDTFAKRKNALAQNFRVGPAPQAARPKPTATKTFVEAPPPFAPPPFLGTEEGSTGGQGVPPPPPPPPPPPAFDAPSGVKKTWGTVVVPTGEEKTSPVHKKAHAEKTPERAALFDAITTGVTLKRTNQLKTATPTKQPDELTQALQARMKKNKGDKGKPPPVPAKPKPGAKDKRA